MRTLDDYDEAFYRESNVEYPALDAFERQQGFKIARIRLEQVARVLQCPLKRVAPCWQHGRLLYSAARKYLDWWAREREGGKLHAKCFLDIGTAKGFSALMLRYAVRDAYFPPSTFPVFSVDVIDPEARVLRNTPAEVDGPKTLHEIVRPFGDAATINFMKSTGRDWLRTYPGHVCFAFIDGKHNYDEVNAELALLTNLQRTGDVCVLDDLQVPGVAKALEEHRHAYTWELIEAVPIKTDRAHGDRVYAVARRR
jgi:predicted O-methyltransferase YrrM